MAKNQAPRRTREVLVTRTCLTPDRVAVTEGRATHNVIFFRLCSLENRGTCNKDGIFGVWKAGTLVQCYHCSEWSVECRQYQLVCTSKLVFRPVQSIDFTVCWVMTEWLFSLGSMALGVAGAPGNLEVCVDFTLYDTTDKLRGRVYGTLSSIELPMLRSFMSEKCQLSNWHCWLS